MEARPSGGCREQDKNVETANQAGGEESAGQAPSGRENVQERAEEGGCGETGGGQGHHKIGKGGHRQIGDSKKNDRQKDCNTTGIEKGARSIKGCENGDEVGRKSPDQATGPEGLGKEEGECRQGSLEEGRHCQERGKIQGPIETVGP